MVPVRALTPLLGSAVKFSAELPEPLPEPLTRSQVAPEVTVEVQLQVGLLVLTEKLPLWPAAAAEDEAGLMEYVHATTGVTMRVTGTTRGELVAEAEVMVTEPG